jgi:predicted SAM-dependent methyltransferase
LRNILRIPSIERSPLASAIRRVRYKRSGKRLVANYLSLKGTRKLQIGGGWRRLDGWLNTDLEYVPNVLQMDATQQFPLPDNTFDYIFSEHMIEHVYYSGGVSMLCECHRVLRPGGVLRLVTPDLASVISLYGAEPMERQRSYLSFFYETFIPEGQPANPACAVNALFRLWGHKFLYDEETLRGAMRAAGFRSIIRQCLGESVHTELRNLENEQRYPEGLLDFESVALEGRK